MATELPSGPSDDAPRASDTRGSGPTGPLARLRRAHWPAHLPPARVTWIALVVLAGYGFEQLMGLPAASLLALPLTAVLVDLLFQRVRFPSLRFPDAALATGLFLSLLLPPTVPLLGAIAVTVGAIGLRHTVRTRGRPVFNPAATGLVFAILLFGFAPAWWVALGHWGEYLLVALGLVLFARTPASWRLPATFFPVYGVFAGIEHLWFGAATSARVLFLTAIDPSIVFFGLFMLTEPRTAPSRPYAQPLYAAVVALAAVFLSAVLPTLGVFLALLAGNLLALVVVRRIARPTRAPAARAARRRGTARARSWSIPTRASIAVLVLVGISLVAGAAHGPSQTPSVLVSSPGGTGTSGGGSVGGGVGAVSCSKDNASIPSSTLSYLHNTLGPSVVLSYNGATGTVVFYDPVNQVTVTETDLYEDYGYAEFNGDDYTTSGCA
jgi:Na+-translocating ferredoxin:NAD+ oxidoreductase RnfD subunit